MNGSTSSHDLSVKSSAAMDNPPESKDVPAAEMGAGKMRVYLESRWLQ
jgi:hypothetical protein